VAIITKRWMVIFLVLPHLRIFYPFGLELQPFLFWWKFAIVFALIVIYKEINFFNFVITLIISLTFFSSVYHGFYSFGLINNLVMFIAFIIYISYAIRTFKELITGLYMLFSVLILLNFISMLTGGIDLSSRGTTIYLLGGKNNIIFTILPAIAIMYIYSYIKTKRMTIFPFIFIMIGVLSVYLSKSSTGIVVVTLTVFFIFFKNITLPSFNKNLFIYVCIFFLIIIYRLQDILLGNFIVNVLKKDITFTGRTYIWDVLIVNIKQSPLLGVGKGNNVVKDSFPTIEGEHNMILQIAMDSGVLGLILFITLLFLIGRKLVRSNYHIFSRILSITVFFYLISGLMESTFYNREFWMLLILAYCLERIIKQVENREPFDKSRYINSSDDSQVPIGILKIH
jgi:O-antigen ligase